MNNYYVYEWIRLDTNEPFYVGKGKDDRWRDKIRGRNNHFNNIVNKIPVAVNILHDNLEEQVAFGLECYYIWLYRDIIGYNICNINDGGEGNSMCGIENPKARSIICLNTNEIFDTISHAVKCLGGNITGIWQCCNNERKYSGTSKEGEPLTWMFLEDYKKTNKKIIEDKIKNTYKYDTRIICITTNLIFKNCKEAGLYYNINKSGIGKCCKGEYSFAGKLEDGTILIWKKLSEYKKMNKHDIQIEKEKTNIKCSNKVKEKDDSKTKSIICLTTKKIFYTAIEASKYYGCDNSEICKCCKRYTKRRGKMCKVEYAGKLSDGTKLVWRYLNWKHNKKYRIKRG